jgi:hypothetical protein
MVHLSEGRSPADLVLPWMIIGELEITRLANGSGTSTQAELEHAATIASSFAGRGSAPAQNELGAMISAFPVLPEWARLFLGRLVVFGLRYAYCLRCEEILDTDWDGTWRVGNLPVQKTNTSEARLKILDTIREQATIHRAASLQKVHELAGKVRCPNCAAENDVIALLAAPLEVPA